MLGNNCLPRGDTIGSVKRAGGCECFNVANRDERAFVFTFNDFSRAFGRRCDDGKPCRHRFDYRKTE